VIRALLLGTTLLAAAACRPPSPRVPSPSELLAADDARATAMIDGDRGLLDRVLDDDLTYSHSNGRVDSKTTLVVAIESKRVEYRSIDPGRRAARIVEGAGIVTGPVRIVVVSGGRAHRIEAVYTAVYRRDRRGWYLVAYHSSPTK